MDDKLKILIVDDEFISGLLLKKILEQEGHKVTGLVSNGNDTIESIKQNRPDLIIMDILLTGKLNGLETVKKIQESDNIPVIFITGYSEDEIVEKALSLNPVAVLSKPYNKYELFKIISEIKV